MKAFAALIDRIVFTGGRNAKLALVTEYLRAAPDPERGYALAALTGALSFRNAKPNLLRQMITERTDPVLFALSYDYVGDLSETVALLWPAQGASPNRPAPTLTEVVEALDALPTRALPERLALWLDALDETGRWALLKLITGGLRIGMSARLAKTAAAALGARTPDEVEEVWHSLSPPYLELFAWLEGRSDHIAATDPAPFRTPMLAHPMDADILETLDPAAHLAEWKWDGVRVQAVAGAGADGATLTRLYSRTGDDISAAFPDVVDALPFRAAAIDGELLVVIGGVVQPFGALQKRLNRKAVSKKMLADAPAHIRAYDLLSENGEDLRALPFEARRARLEAFIAANPCARMDISPLVPFETRDALARAQADPASAGGGAATEAIEGVMVKRRDSPYLPGRPRGPWWKWKRDPFIVDAVLMYAQRGHGKRASFYSDYTFGVWKGETLTPVGKAYFGFTDEELQQIDRFVRTHTTARFGPVREVAHSRETGLVFEVAFEGLNRSGRNKSGLAMRFPRISRIRWDKPPAEAGTIAELEALLETQRK